MAGVPVAKVEIEFTADTWTDVTAWWDASQPVTLTGGRADTDSRVGPGRLTGLTLVNDDGRFTVGNASGAYWPNVRAGKRVRLLMSTAASSDAMVDAFTDSFTTTDTPSWIARFTGYVDGWPLTWGPNGSTCVATLSATDALRLLDPVVRDGAWLELGLAAADAYWPFNDATPGGSHLPVVDPALGGWMVPVGSPSPPTEQGPPADPRPLPIGIGANDHYASLNPGDIAMYGAACVFKGSSAPPAGWRLLSVESLGHRVAVGLADDGSGCLRGSWIYDAGVTAVHTEFGLETTNICDGEWWLITLRAVRGADWWITLQVSATRIDGTYATSGAVSGVEEWDGVMPPGGTYIQLHASPPPGGVVGHVTWWTTGDVASIDPALFRGLPVQSLFQWATLAGTLSGVTVPIEYGPGDVGATTLRNRPSTGSASEMWRLVEEATGGLTHARRDGTLRYLHGGIREHPFGPAALTVTAADIAPPLTLDADLVKIVNDVTVTLRDAAGVVYGSLRTQDATSIDLAGRRAVAREVYGAPPDGTLTGLVAGLLNTSESPRVPSLQIDLAGASEATQAAVLSGEWDGGPIDVWSLISVTDLPTVGGWVSSWQARVEGWTETLSIRDWSIRFNVSDATGVS